FMPLRKSNASAMAINARSNGKASVPASMSFYALAPSDVLDNNAVQHIGDVVETVHHFLEMIVDLVADVEGKAAAADIGAIKFAQAFVVQFVGTAFERGDLCREIAEMHGLAADRLHHRDGLLHQLCAAHD